MTDWLPSLVSGAKHLGLNYGFVLNPFERTAWLSGIGVTLELVALALAASLLAGVGMAVLLTSNRPWLQHPVRVLIELTRNTPVLVQLYCAFFVVNMLLNRVLDGAQHNPLTAFAWVIIVLSIHYGAFHAEALRAGIESVPAGMRESAASLGFSRRQLLWHVELPLAIRFALPSLINNLINLVKTTALGSAIAVGEVTYTSLMIWTQHDNVLELMLFIFLVYGLLTLLVARLGRRLEHRLRMPGYGH
ncbi:amino acid ABC transporter permease [Paludibacterium yongneupense]|uniref:amino acid ABC transporter permease n=1 Tax=Paludibacterium yongneupense TaxID=400061 RepID=UPI0003F8E6C3|nr:amino acid ABC transporter permease [Paludibacterium yongneupense]